MLTILTPGHTFKKVNFSLSSKNASNSLDMVSLHWILFSLHRACLQVDGVISGFPCISVSPLNMYDLEFRDTTQATGCGWQSVRQFIRKFRPQWAILENVKSLAHCRKADNYHKPVDHICSVMRKLGYIPAYDVVNTLNFGLPQSRARCWMMFIRADCQHDQADLLGSFRSFMLQPCGLGKVLVGGHDPVGKFGGIVRHSTNKASKWQKKLEEARKRLGSAPWLEPPPAFKV